MFLSFSTADEGFHAPNEFFRLSSLRVGHVVWARCLESIGRQAAADCSPYR